MNWFWIAVAVLAGLGILILGIGALLPREHRAACTIRLRAAPHDVWSAITDWRALPSWRTELSSVEELPGGGGWVETSKWGRMPMRIERSEPQQVLVTRIADETLPFGGTWTWQLEAMPGGGTRVTTTEDGFVKPALFRFFSRFVFGHHTTLRTVQLALAAKFGDDAKPAAH
jgi:hypothetical protein